MPWPTKVALAMLTALMMRKALPPAVKTGRPTSFEPEVAMAIGTVIRRHREAAGIAQDVFAAKAGVDRSYYGKLERGERQPSIGVLLRIAKAMHIAGALLVEEAEVILAERPATSQTSALLHR